MDQRDQEQKIAVPESANELKPSDLEKVSGGRQPVQLPKNEEKDR